MEKESWVQSGAAGGLVAFCCVSQGHFDHSGPWRCLSKAGADWDGLCSPCSCRVQAMDKLRHLVCFLHCGKLICLFPGSCLCLCWGGACSVSEAEWRGLRFALYPVVFAFCMLATQINPAVSLPGPGRAECPILKTKGSAVLEGPGGQSSGFLPVPVGPAAPSIGQEPP
jgi:hypothetical protein